jgi:hypothetical protein
MRGVCILAWVAAGALVAMATTVACSSFSSASEPTDAGFAEGGVAEGGVPDGQVAEDAAPETGVPPGAKNLLLNADFEIGCAGWEAMGAVLSSNTNPAFAHSGKGSCLVCTSGAPGEVFVQTKADVPVGAVFYGGAFLRRAPDAGAPPPIAVNINVADPTGAGLQQGPPAPTSILDETYAPTTAVVMVSASDAGALYLYFTTAEPGRCYFIDDAWLYRKD